MFSSKRTKAEPKLEIITDSQFIIFNGRPEELAGTTVPFSGKVALTTNASIDIKNIRVRLSGKHKVSWIINNPNHPIIKTKERIFDNAVMVMTVPSSSTTISAGRSEFPFTFDLPGDLHESLEGMRMAYCIYTLTATVERSVLSSNVTAEKHMRLIRTLSRDDLDLITEKCENDIWPDKIRYNITLPADTFIFGTSFPVDFELIPLRKGLKFDEIRMTLHESTAMNIYHKKQFDANGNRQLQNSNESDYTVAREVYTMPEDSRVIPDETEVDPENPLNEKYHFTLNFQLPRSLKECRQDMKNGRVIIKHRLVLEIDINNPEGHVSQVCSTYYTPLSRYSNPFGPPSPPLPLNQLPSHPPIDPIPIDPAHQLTPRRFKLICKVPLKLFISPNYSFDDLTNRVTFPTGNDGSNISNTINAQEARITAPPDYQAHHLDQLYHGLDTGIHTPHGGTSGANTPRYVHSRNASNENLPAVAEDEDVPPLPHHAQAGPSSAGPSSDALHSRLQALQLTGPIAGGGLSHPSRRETRHSSNNSSHASPSNSTPASRRGSGADGTEAATTRTEATGSTDATVASAIPSDVASRIAEVESLSRVPSYNTAVRTPGPITPREEVPPTYETAVSRPHSPVQEDGGA